MSYSVLCWSALQGTWCAIDVGLSHKDKEVKDLVKQLRQQRVGMVQTSEQYGFVHRVLGNSGIPANEMAPYPCSVFLEARLFSASV